MRLETIGSRARWALGAAAIVVHAAGASACRADALLDLAAPLLANTSVETDASRESAGPRDQWISLALLGGSLQFDSHLADYQWSVAPRATWGAQLLAGAGRLASGARVWRAETTQNLGLAGVPNPNVQAVSVEWVTQGRLARTWGAEILASVCLGRLMLGYQPDHVTVPSSAPSGSSDVELKAIHEWTGGGGIAMRRPLQGAWSAGFEIDRQVFAMNTAHRDGTTIATGRETFGEWSARIELARVLGRR